MTYDVPLDGRFSRYLESDVHDVPPDLGVWVRLGSTLEGLVDSGILVDLGVRDRSHFAGKTNLNAI